MLVREGENINGDCNKDWHEKVGNKRWTVVQSGYVDPQQRRILSETPVLLFHCVFLIYVFNITENE